MKDFIIGMIFLGGIVFYIYFTISSEIKLQRDRDELDSLRREVKELRTKNK